VSLQYQGKWYFFHFNSQPVVSTKKEEISKATLTNIVLFAYMLALVVAETCSSQPPDTVSVVSGPTMKEAVLTTHGVDSSKHCMEGDSKI
jgi:hypothetical protein